MGEIVVSADSHVIDVADLWEKRRFRGQILNLAQESRGRVLNLEFVEVWSGY